MTLGQWAALEGLKETKMSVYLGSGVGNVPRLTFSPLTPAGPTGPGGPYMIKAMCDAQHLPAPCWGTVSRPVTSPPWAAPHTLSFSQNCCQPRHTYRTASWPCLSKITLRAKQRTRGQSRGGTQVLGQSQTSLYKSSHLEPPDYSSFPDWGN